MGICLDYHNITKRYGANTVVHDATFKVAAGEFFTLLGPSGCGKTTLLRMTAGFNSIEGGEIRFNDEVINHKPAHLRNIGMVFQNYAVFPHLSVAQNVAYGLKTRKVAKDEIEARITEAMDHVKINSYRDRSPSNLSGGQQQRIALARAIVIRPDILLMDEPLSNLDAKLRVQMRTTIKRIQAELGITTLYVTHDQEEALAISDRIAVMNEGRIQQIGTPERIYSRPANSFVASFIGVSNLLPSWMDAPQNGHAELALGDNYRVRIPHVRKDAPAGKVLVSARPDDFRIHGPAEPGIKGRMVFSTYLGNYMQYFILLDNGLEVEVWQYHDEKKARIAINTPVSLSLVESRINVFTEDGGSSLMSGEA